MSTLSFARMATGSRVLALIAGCCFATAARADSLDGWWVSDGYGILLEIKGDQMKASEITAISCLPHWTAKGQAKTSEDAQAVFVLTQAPVNILLQPGRSADHKFLQSPGAASRVGLRRIMQPPPACDKPTANTPLNNFDIFWTTFEEHYPFFALHGVNWKEVRDKYRPRVTDKTTPDELFDIFKAMIKPLHDAHTAVRGPSPKQRYNGERKGTQPIDAETSQKIREIIETHYTHGKLKTWCNGRVSFGMLPDSIGYLRITAFAGYANRPGFDAQVQALEEALDQAFQDGAKLKGLVIDVRINHGGSDVLGVAVAARLATRDYLAFAKKARNDPSDPSQFTTPQETQVRVSTRPHFHGKVVLLTGSNTVSAGETFTMALMGRAPPVVRVGESTQGVFSDVLGRSLPNGFRFRLPNEIFLTQDGKAFDGPGIPPHVPIAVFPREDLAKGRDGCLENAKEILAGN
jgi:hypothetical protein